jgi:hypothetical protein
LAMLSQIFDDQRLPRIEARPTRVYTIMHVGGDVVTRLILKGFWGHHYF